MRFVCYHLITFIVLIIALNSCKRDEAIYPAKTIPVRVADTAVLDTTTAVDSTTLGYDTITYALAIPEPGKITYTIDGKNQVTINKATAGVDTIDMKLVTSMWAKKGKWNSVEVAFKAGKTGNFNIKTFMLTYSRYTLGATAGSIRVLSFASAGDEFPTLLTGYFKCTALDFATHKTHKIVGAFNIN